jgi:hypothetical protein
MNRLKIFKFQLWAAIEYVAGYEFPVWRKGKWVRVAQWKLDPFITE